MKRLIITADDFGMCESVNNAIIECIDAEVVLSTNIMVNMKAAHEAFKLRQCRSRISVGLHWNLTTGRPITIPEVVDSIVDRNGEFLSARELRNGLRANKISKEQIKRELEAQYRGFRNLYGEKPSYWNTHENIHINPHLFKLFVDLASEIGIYRMRSHEKILVNGSDGTVIRNSPMQIVKKLIIKRWNNYAMRKKMKMPGGVLAFAKYVDRYSIREFYSSINWKVSNNTAEMFIHPSTDSEGEFFGDITKGRVKEYEMCIDQSLPSFLRDKGIEISNFEVVG